MMVTGEDIKLRGSSFITEVGLPINLNWQRRNMFLLRNLSISDGVFCCQCSVFAVVYIIFPSFVT